MLNTISVSTLFCAPLRNSPLRRPRSGLLLCRFQREGRRLTIRDAGCGSAPILNRKNVKLSKSVEQKVLLLNGENNRRRSRVLRAFSAMCSTWQIGQGR